MGTASQAEYRDLPPRLPAALNERLVACGIRSLPDLTSHSIESLLSICRLDKYELRLIEGFLAEHAAALQTDLVHYPFVSPLLLEQLRAEGIDTSVMSISAIGLPVWAETPLAGGGFLTVAQLAGASTFYVRTVLGYGGRPQSLVRQRLEEYLFGLLRSEAAAPGELDQEPARLLNSLHLPRRTTNALRRAGVYTVDQLLRMDEAQLTRIRGLGPQGLATLRSLTPAVDSAPAPAADPVVHAEAVSVRPEVARRPVSDLDLTPTLVRRLQDAGIATVGDLLGEEGVKVLNIPRVGKSAEGRIRAAVEKILLETLSEVGEAAPIIVAESKAEGAATGFGERVETLVGTLNSERLRRLLVWRFGLHGKVWTLEEVGREIKVSRERVRQLERAALITLIRRHAAEFELLARPVHEAVAEVGGVAPMTYILHQLPGLYKLEGVSTFGAARLMMETAPSCSRMPGGLCRLYGASETYVAAIDEAVETTLRKRMEPLSIEELTTSLRGNTPFAEVVRQFPSFSLAARARANPRTHVLPDGAIVLKEWSRTKVDNAVRALRSLGSPTHYRKIAERMTSDASGETPTTEETVHNLLLSEAMFVGMGRGVFGLAEWQAPGPELAAQLEIALSRAGVPLHPSELASRLLHTERAVERALITDDRFAPVGRGYYRLTAEQSAGSDVGSAEVGASRRARPQPPGRRASVRELSTGPGGEFVRIHVSPATRRSGALALNTSLLSLFPTEGPLRTAWPSSASDGATYSIRRGRSHISGLGRFIHAHNVMPGDSIYIERTVGEEPVYNLYTENQWHAATVGRPASPTV